MCMSLRIEPREMTEVLVKIRKMSLAQEMSKKLGKSLTISGDLYPADIAPVLAPNKYGNMAVFPMAWGFTHKATTKPIANCRVETAESKPLWRDSWYRRRCVIPASLYYEWGYPVYEDDSRNMIEHRNAKKDNTQYRPKAQTSHISQGFIVMKSIVICRYLCFLYLREKQRVLYEIFMIECLSY